MDTEKNTYYSRIEKIMKNISYQELGRFSKLKCDYDRFKLLFQNAEVQKEIGGYISNWNESKSANKSDSSAKEYRDKGNKCYKAADVGNALRFYNLAVMKANAGNDYEGFSDSFEECSNEEKSFRNAAGSGKDGCKTRLKNEDSSEISFCLANRSACLIYMHQKQQKKQLQPLYQAQHLKKSSIQQYDYLKESIKDIRDSIIHGYPKHQKFKLLERKIKCLKMMEEEGQRMLPKTLNDYLECIEVAGLEEKYKCELVEKTKRDIDYNISSNQTHFSFSKSPHSIPPKEETLTKIEYTPEKGNHVVLNKTLENENCAILKTGSVIMQDKTFFRVLDEDYFEKRCYSCLKNINLSTQCIIPCIGCSQILFCSYKCRKFGMEVLRHLTECKVLSDLIASQTGCITRLALCILLNVGLEKWFEINDTSVIKECENSDDSMTKINTTSSDDLKDDIYKDAHCINRLLTHSNKRSSMELLQYGLLSVYLVSLLQRKSSLFVDLSGVKKEEDTSSMAQVENHRVFKCGAIILKLLQIIACNGIEMTETTKNNCTTTPTCNLKQTIFNLEPTKTGLALYPQASFFNHSCFPDVEFIFHQDFVTAVTLKPVQLSQELCVDYGLLFHLTPRDERLSQLRGHYFFDCKCTACYQNWPLKNQLPLKAAVEDSDERNKKRKENSQEVIDQGITDDFTGITDDFTGITDDFKSQNDSIALERAMLGAGKDFIGNLSNMVASNMAGLGGLPEDDKGFDKLMKKALKDVQNMNKKNVLSSSNKNISSPNLNKTLHILSIEEAIEKANRMEVNESVIQALQRYIDHNYHNHIEHTPSFNILHAISTLKLVYRLAGIQI